MTRTVRASNGELWYVRLSLRQPVLPDMPDSPLWDEAMAGAPVDFILLPVLLAVMAIRWMKGRWILLTWRWRANRWLVCACNESSDQAWGWNTTDRNAGEDVVDGLSAGERPSAIFPRASSPAFRLETCPED